MPEAERLGDRVCIIVRGELQCLAPPLTLKLRHGKGSQVYCRFPVADLAAAADTDEPLSVEENQVQDRAVGVAASALAVAVASAHVATGEVDKAIIAAERDVRGARKAANEKGGRVALVAVEDRRGFTIQLLNAGQWSMGAVFLALQACERSGAIGDFAISVPTLEQVFMKMVDWQAAD